ncbi:MAG TPA: hypothetical protein VK694_00590 [Verrucomicrobiae bacterium]|nr:hypothetical protein [Verrucomicrobiae bacterium]
MTNKRFFYVLLGIVVLLSLLTVAGVVVGSSLLTKETQNLTDLKLENKVQEEQKIAVTQAKRDIVQYAELNKIAKQIVPQDKDQAQTVRELTKLAADSGIPIDSITFPSSTLGQAVAKPATPAAGETAAPKPTAPPITQVKPVEGMTGVYQLEISLQANSPGVTFSKLITFLQKLETNRRTAQVSSINITPDSLNPTSVKFTLVVNVFIKP